MRDEVLAKFAALRRRHLWVRGVDLFLEIAFVMTVSVGAMLLLDRLAFELGWAAPHLSQPAFVVATLTGALIMSALLAAGMLVARPASPAALAWRADRAMGADDRFLSALEFAAAGTGGGFPDLVMAEAARLPVDPKRVLPRSPVGYRWAIVLTLLAGGVLMAYPPQVWPAPTAAFRAMPVRGAAPLDVRFEDLSQGAIDEWTWEFGDGAKATGESVAHVYDKAGTYTARLRLDGPGGSARHEIAIEILPPGHPVADFEADPVKGRAPLRVRFANASQNADQFAWDFGDGAASKEREPAHVYAKPGEYSVTLKATGPLGSDTARRHEYVRALAEDAPRADFRGHPRQGDAPLVVLFEDMSDGKIASWEWNFGDPYASRERFGSERAPTHIYRMPGTYTVSLKVRGPGGEDAEEKIAYIKVGNGDGKGGGGGEGAGQGGARQPRGKSGAGTEKGQLFGDRTKEHDVQLDPSVVNAESRGGEMVEKSKRIYTKKDGGGGDKPIEQVFPDYRRAAEDTMSREHIPPSVRDYVKSYFDKIQPK